MKDFQFPMNSAKEVDRNKKNPWNKLTFSFMFRTIANLFKIPFYDECCKNDNKNGLPVSFNEENETVQRYDPATNTYVDVPSGGGGGIQSIVEGDNITIDNTDPLNPVVNSETNLPYLVYTALLEQSGSNAPTATILQNTLGFVPTWLYNSIGSYKTNESFPSNKTLVFLTFNAGESSNSSRRTLSAFWNETGEIYLNYSRMDAADEGDGPFLIVEPVNNLDFGTSIEIRVYP